MKHSVVWLFLFLSLVLPATAQLPEGRWLLKEDVGSTYDWMVFEGKSVQIRPLDSSKQAQFPPLDVVKLSKDSFGFNFQGQTLTFFRRSGHRGWMWTRELADLLIARKAGALESTLLGTWTAYGAKPLDDKTANTVVITADSLQYDTVDWGEDEPKRKVVKGRLFPMAVEKTGVQDAVFVVEEDFRSEIDVRFVQLEDGVLLIQGSGAEERRMFLAPPDVPQPEWTKLES